MNNSSQNQTYVRKMSLFLGICQGIGIPKEIYMQFALLLKNDPKSFIYEERNDDFPDELEITSELTGLLIKATMIAEENGASKLAKIYQKFAEDSSTLSENYLAEYEKN